MKKYLLITAGLLSLAVGIVGLFLPLIPTTGPLILSTFCFARSSPRLHAWILGHPTFGPRIKLYLERRALTLKTKVVAVSTLWASILLSAFLVDKLLVRIILVLIAVGVSTYLLHLKTYRGEIEEKKVSLESDSA